MNAIKPLIETVISPLSLVLLTLPTSCKNASTAEATTNETVTIEKAGFRALPSGVFLENDVRQSFDTIGYVSGKFGYSDNDTLYCIALGCDYYKDPSELDEYDVGFNTIDNYVLTNHSLNFPDLYLNIPFLNDIQTADLDCDGIEELIVYHGGYMSYWHCFEAFSLENGQWNRILPIVPVNIAHREDIPDTPAYKVACDDHPDSMIIFVDKFQEEDPTEIVTEEKLVRIEKEPVTMESKTCYSLPGGEPIELQ